jgi:hypothetical protein
MVDVGGAQYRVQALSPRVVRVELKGPTTGFEDRATFFALNRSSFTGVDITSTKTLGNVTLLTTAHYTIELAPPSNTVRPPPSENGPGSSCRNPLDGFGPVKPKPVADQTLAFHTSSLTQCCAACDKTTGCNAWTFVPGSAKQPTGGVFVARKCNSSRTGQMWTFTQPAWTNVKSAAKGSGCWEINACSTGDGAHIGTSFGCKILPKPGFKSPCDANMAWTFQLSNNSIVSVMDGKCLTLSSSGAPVASTCKSGNKMQHWEWSATDHSDSVGTRTSISMIKTAGGLCLDNSPDSPAPVVIPANCTLLASSEGVTGRGGMTIGGDHAGGSFKGGDSSGCAVTLRGPSSGADGDGPIIWHSPSFASTSAQLHAPPPSLVQPSTSVLAILDAPRFVPPTLGAVSPSAYPNGKLPPSAQPYAATSGYDVTNHAPDLYLFVAGDGTADTSLSPFPSSSPSLPPHVTSTTPAASVLAYASLRKDFMQMSGNIPALPAWAFGFW